MYGLDVGTLEASGLQVDNYAQFNNYVDVKGGLSVGSSLKVDGDAGFNGVLTANSTTTLNAALVDGFGKEGLDGQLLSSTSTRTQWITAGILPATTGQKHEHHDLLERCRLGKQPKVIDGWHHYNDNHHRLERYRHRHPIKLRSSGKR